MIVIKKGNYLHFLLKISAILTRKSAEATKIYENADENTRYFYHLSMYK